MFKTFQAFMRRSSTYSKNSKYLTTKKSTSSNQIWKRPIPKFPVYQKAPESDISDALKTLKTQVNNGEDISLETYFNKGTEESSLALLKDYMTLVQSGRPLVAIDCESYEWKHNCITEIGISILKNNSKTSIIPEIETIHVVVNEYFNMRNSKYVPDKKDFFMGGTSHVLSETNARLLLQKVLNKYINQQDGILVGHQVSAELSYFSSIGVQYKPDVKILDTMKIQRISRFGGNSLWATLKMLQIPYGYLHNAGNDAYFTLLAALSLCDPKVRINKNLDIYSDSPYKGIKAQHHDKAEYFLVEDVDSIVNNL
ncbi:GFD2 Good for full DBP5 activity protein 2 [Candida maltosa Xu316]